LYCETVVAKAKQKRLTNDNNIIIIKKKNQLNICTLALNRSYIN